MRHMKRIFALLIFAAVPLAAVLHGQTSTPPIIPTVTIPTSCFNFFYALTTTTPWTIYAPNASGGCQALVGGGSAYNPASVAITGGTINGTTIGATTPATGAFTTASTTGDFTAGRTLQASGNPAAYPAGAAVVVSSTQILAQTSPGVPATLNLQTTYGGAIIVGSGTYGFFFNALAASQVYRCSGGTLSGNIVISPSTQATACTTGGGTLVASGIYVQ